MMNDGLLTRMLITQGTHPFAQRLAKLLPGFDGYFGIIDPHSPLLQTKRYLLMPRAENPSFVHGLLRNCLDHRIQLLVPLGEGELMPLAQAAPLFSEYGIDVLLPSFDDLPYFPVIADPARDLEPVVVYRGKNISPTSAMAFPDGLSGVFAGSDDGTELALCCVADA